MKASIALAVLNGEKYLPPQLESFLRQTRPPDELVICDNGSDDRTEEIVQEFSSRAPFPVRFYRNEKNIGYARNFERASAFCRGDIIFWSDHDDVWSPEKIADFCNRFQSDPDLLALFSDSELVDQQLRPVGGTLFQVSHFTSQEKALLRNGEGWRVFARHNVIAGNTVAFRSSLVPLLREIPLGVVHDAWLFALVVSLGKIDFFDKCYVKYRLHGNQNVSVLRGSFLNVLRSRLQRATRWERRHWTDEAGRLRAYLSQPEVAAKVELCEALQEKAAWLEGRAAFSTWRLLRLPSIVLNASNYKKFENGFSSMVKDLVVSLSVQE